MQSYTNRSVFDNVLEDLLKNVIYSLRNGLPGSYNHVLSLEGFIWPYIKDDSEYIKEKERLTTKYNEALEEAKRKKDKSDKEEKIRTSQLEYSQGLWKALNTALKNQNLHPASQDMEDEPI